MAWHMIPLEPVPMQAFYVTVDVGGTNVSLYIDLRYNTEASYWRMDVCNGITRECLIAGVPLLTGEAPSGDLLRQFKYLGLGYAVIVQLSDITDDDIPGLFDLGSDFVLLWGEPDE